MKLLRFFLLFNVILLAGLFLMRGKIAELQQPQTPLADYGKLAAFRLTDQKNAEVTPDFFKEKLWVMDFIFTKCPNQCPMMSFKMSALQKALPKSVYFASISVDPEYDTPAVLSEYAKRFGAEEGRWLFLTGEKEEIDRLLKSVHLGDSGEPSMHSIRFILIDKNRAIRGYYNSEEKTPIENLKKDVRQLL